jgi:hypothetical protein
MKIKRHDNRMVGLELKVLLYISLSNVLIVKRLIDKSIGYLTDRNVEICEIMSEKHFLVLI